MLSLSLLEDIVCLPNAKLCSGKAKPLKVLWAIKYEQEILTYLKSMKFLFSFRQKAHVIKRKITILFVKIHTEDIVLHFLGFPSF